MGPSPSSRTPLSTPARSDREPTPQFQCVCSSDLRPSPIRASPRLSSASEARGLPQQQPALRLGVGSALAHTVREDQRPVRFDAVGVPRQRGLSGLNRLPELAGPAERESVIAQRHLVARPDLQRVSVVGDGLRRPIRIRAGVGEDRARVQAAWLVLDAPPRGGYTLTTVWEPTRPAAGTVSYERDQQHSRFRGFLRP